MILKAQSVGLLSVLFLASGMLTSCNSSPQPSVISKPSLEKYDQAVTLQGAVSNNDGPVKHGVVKALTEQGQLLASVELAGSARYSLEVPGGTALPVLVAYYPTAEAKASERMIAVAIHANTSKYDINPLSTRIAEQAKSLGGYTHNNLVRAAESTGTVPASNKTTAGFRGDPTTQYGGWH